jgi:hypothetical protein
MRRVVCAGLAVVALAGLGACGDAPSADRRGYTKSTLERPGIIIRPQESNEMNRLGTPNRPRGERLPEPAAPGAPAANP